MQYKPVDFKYWAILVLVGEGLGILLGLGADWLPVLIAGVSLFLAVLIVWWERHGKDRVNDGG